MLGKFCVFCGGKPKDKGREHIFPQWLLKMTGKPSRTVKLGIDWKTPESGMRRFSFSAFTFPACKTCNNEFSKLETDASRVIAAMLVGSPLGAPGIETLFDWLDKIRVGVWLGMMCLNENMYHIRPMYFIKDRMAASDRLVFVYRGAESGKGITWAGSESPIFNLMPTCMWLRINDLHLFNASSAFLFSPRMGFPSQEIGAMRAGGRGEYYMTVRPGSEKVDLPLVPVQIHSPC